MLLQVLMRDCEEGFRSEAGLIASAQSRVARLLLEKLSEQCESYCILTGYEGLPDSFDSDIDFMVSVRDFARMPNLIDEIAAATGTRLFQAIPHEVSARAFRLAAESDAGPNFIQPDSCWDYRHFGKLWLRADEVLAARRQHPRGFWIPGAAYEFIYYLIKRVNKSDFTQAHAARLSLLYRQDPSGSERLLQRFWKANSAAAMGKMATSGDWTPLIEGLGEFRAELRRHSAESFSAKVASYIRGGFHTIERVVQPTGGWIAFMGPDGCGKSSAIEGVVADFSPAFQKIVRFHLRPKSLPARANSDVSVTDPHGRPVRGGLFSVAKMFYLFADYWLGYLSGVRSATVRTRLVVFDRYFYDIVVDPERVLYGGPKWLPRFLAYFLPKPDMVFLLNADPEALWSRKQEVPYEEVVRQQKGYMELARRLKGTVIIDAARSKAEVVIAVREAILDHFSRRTRLRLHLAARR